MAKRPPVHRDLSKLTEVPQTGHKETKKHFTKSVFVLEPASADHIAANIYLKRRNFSFRAAVTLLQSMRIDLFTNTDYPDGYIAYGSPEPSGHYEDKYLRKGRLAVVFKLKLNERLQKKVVEILTGWSENLTKIDVQRKTINPMAIRYAKWKESPEEIQEQIRIAEELIRPLGFPPKKKSARKKSNFTLTVEKIRPDLSLVLTPTKKQSSSTRKKPITA